MVPSAVSCKIVLFISSLASNSSSYFSIPSIRNHFIDFLQLYVSGISSLQLLAIQAVAGMDSLSWHEPQIRPVIGWLILKILYFYCPRTFFRQDRCCSKVLGLGWCSSSTTGSLAWLQRMAISDTESSITRNLHWRILGVSAALGFHILPPMPFNSSHL